MKRCLVFLLIIGAFYRVSWSWPRLGAAANLVTQNSGDKTQGISVSLSSTAAKIVYTGTPRHREVFLENTDTTYKVHCGTFSTVSATSGIPRWILPANNIGFTTNATSSIWCIGEAGSGSIEVVGSYEFDSKDTVQP